MASHGVNVQRRNKATIFIRADNTVQHKIYLVNVSYYYLKKPMLAPYLLSEFFQHVTVLCYDVIAFLVTQLTFFAVKAYYVYSRRNILTTLDKK